MYILICIYNNFYLYNYIYLILKKQTYKLKIYIYSFQIKKVLVSHKLKS